MAGKQHGFLLKVGDNCIFRSLPVESEQFETTEAEVLYELQNIGEFIVIENSNGLNISHPEYDKPITLIDNVLKVGDIQYKVAELENT